MAFLVGCLIVPNLLMLLLSRYVRVDRQLVDVDYLVAGSVVALVPVGLGALIVGIAVVADAFILLSPLTNFDLGDALAAFAQAGDLPTLDVVGLAVLAAVVLGLVSWVLLRLMVRNGHRERRLHWELLLLAAIAFGADLANGSSLWSPGTEAVIPLNIATSAIFKLVRAGYDDYRDGGELNSGQILRPEEMATGSLRRDLASDAGPRAQNVVLVLVESEGLFKDTAEVASLFSDFRSPETTGRYEVRIGSVPFKGSTTSAEFRELCGMRLTYRSAGDVDSSRCLPEILKDRGFATISIHGFKETFFDRARWYPAIGFERSLFDRDIFSYLGDGHRTCGGVYEGACDVDVAKILERELQPGSDARPRFIYWLSLNSHVPFDRSVVEASPFECTTAVEVAEMDICSLTRLVRQVHRAVARIANDSGIAPTRFILVGDHTTPFASGAKRGLFVPGRVPYVELVPR